MINEKRRQLNAWIEEDRLSYPIHRNFFYDRFLNSGFKLTYFHRKCNYYRMKKNHVLSTVYRLLYHRAAHKAGFDVPSHVSFGPGFSIFHPHGILINSNVKFGKGCSIHSGAKIGLTAKDEVPQIGNHVKIGINATIVGNITIGDYAIVGAGAVVVKDVPPKAVVAGNPAKILYIQTEEQIQTRKSF